MDTSTVFPLFEKGLPLRSRDLNAVFRRADDEIRHTRTCLHGMGILYGLHVTVETNKITIQAGAGVTSEGHLYCSHEPVELTRLTGLSDSIIKRQFKAESFGDYLDRPSTTDERNDRVAYQELDNTGHSLSADVLADKWLIVFFELVTEDLKGCATCDKGKRAEIQTKFLLIDPTTWAAVSTLFDCGKLNETDPSNPFKPELQKVPRLDLRDTGCIELAGGNHLSERYGKSIQASFPAIQTELLKTCTVADTLFGLAGKDAVNALNVPALLTETNGQYVHDYLRLIIRAYTEFVTTPFTRHIATLPPKTCFPKHLVLGKFDENGGFLEKERTRFFRPIFAGTTDADFEYARQLYQRLIALLTQADFGSLDTDAKKDLRITPSRRPTAPIGRQAIPFYLNVDEVRKSWRPANQFDEVILSYDAKKQLQNQPFFDEADFYRIEGHVGQRLQNDNNGKNQVEALRDCLNLPFQVSVVGATGEQKDRPSLSDFARQHPGLEHQGGVPSGGTFVMVVRDDDNTIVGDFCLPYWVQPPPPKPVIADFEIEAHDTVPGQGESFTFVNRSHQYDRLEWRVNGGASRSDQEQFTFLFPVGEALVTHYFVTLTAFQENRESVEKTTIVVVRTQDQTPPPRADFAVEEQANIETSEDGHAITVTANNVPEGQPFSINLAFENLSENADTYLWQIDNKKLSKPKTKDKLIQTFTWKNEEVGSKSFTVRLTASRTGQPDNVADKTVTATFPVIL